MKIFIFCTVKFAEFYKNMKNITRIKDVFCKVRTSRSQAFYKVAMPKHSPKSREINCNGIYF